MTNTEADIHCLKSNELSEILHKTYRSKFSSLKKDEKVAKVLEVYRSLLEKDKEDKLKAFQDQVSDLRRGGVFRRVQQAAALPYLPPPSTSFPSSSLPSSSLPSSLLHPFPSFGPPAPLYPHSSPPLQHQNLAISNQNSFLAASPTSAVVKTIEPSPFFEVAQLVAWVHVQSSLTFPLFLQPNYLADERTFVMYIKMLDTPKANFTVIVNSMLALNKQPSKTQSLFLLDLTPFLIMGKENKVALAFTVKAEVLIQRVKKIPVETLAQRVRDTSKLNDQLGIPSSSSSASRHDDIVATVVEVDLTCPLSKIRIVEACRTEKCPHPQCFDLVTFLQLSAKAPVLRCPVCNKQATLEQLRLDRTFQGYLDSTLPTVTTIVLEADGSWRLPSKKTSVLKEQPEVTKVEEGQGKPGKAPLVIDLTFGDDDEDDEDSAEEEGDAEDNDDDDDDDDSGTTDGENGGNTLNRFVPEEFDLGNYVAENSLAAPVAQPPTLISLDSDDE